MHRWEMVADAALAWWGSVRRVWTRTWTFARVGELVALAVSCASVLAVLLVSVVLESDQWWSHLAVGVSSFLASCAALFVAFVTAGNARDREQLARQLFAFHHVTPSGAPRMASVACSEGRTHRFMYGSSGWEEAGPSTEVFPEATARQST